MKRNKKGTLWDNWTVVLTIFGIAVFLVFMFYLISEIQPRMSEQIGDVEQANQTFNSALNNMKGSFDWITLALFGVLVLSIIFSSFLFWAHPIFVVIYFLGSAFLIGGTILVSNLFEKITTTYPLNETISNLPITQYIFTNYPLIMAAVIGLSAIIIYAKRPTANETAI